jgi:hypothetical protein
MRDIVTRTTNHATIENILRNQVDEYHSSSTDKQKEYVDKITYRIALHLPKPVGIEFYSSYFKQTTMIEK